MRFYDVHDTPQTNAHDCKYRLYLYIHKHLIFIILQYLTASSNITEPTLIIIKNTQHLISANTGFQIGNNSIDTIDKCKEEEN